MLLSKIDEIEKDQWRQLAMRGGPFTEEEGLLDYCQEDVDQLLHKMWRLVDLRRAEARYNLKTLTLFTGQLGSLEGRIRAPFEDTTFKMARFDVPEG